MAYIQWHQPPKKIMTWKEWKKQRKKGEYKIVRIMKSVRYPSTTMFFEDGDVEVKLSVPSDIFKQLYQHLKNSVIYYVFNEDGSDGFSIKQEKGFRYFRHDWGWKLIETNEDEIPF